MRTQRYELTRFWPVPTDGDGGVSAWVTLNRGFKFENPRLQRHTALAQKGFDSHPQKHLRCPTHVWVDGRAYPCNFEPTYVRIAHSADLGGPQNRKMYWEEELEEEL